MTATGSAAYGFIDASIRPDVYPSGNLDSGAGLQAAISDAISQGVQQVYLRSGTYRYGTGLACAAPGILIRGPGPGQGCTLAFTGTGDAVRMYNPVANTGGGSGPVFGGGVKDITIDGTAAGAGSAGLHIGDGEDYQLDLIVQNFSGAGSKGVWIDNTIWWTEKVTGKIWAWNCANGVVFDMSGGGADVQNSHGYDDLLITIAAESGQNGVVVQNGAHLYNARLRIRGNFNTGSDSNACLTITGSAANGVEEGDYSQIELSRLDIQVESDGLTPFPQTISIGSASGSTENRVSNCTGIMSFFGTWTAANAYGNSIDGTGVIDFDGYVTGDANLGPAGPGRSAPKLLYGTGFVTVGATCEVPTQTGDIFFFQLTANTTISLIGYESDTSSGPQRITLIVKQAAAGSKTVTWPRNAGPTNALPYVEFPGGTPPTMTATASAIDQYDLVTLDGIVWYAVAHQAMG